MHIARAYKFLDRHRCPITVL